MKGRMDRKGVKVKEGKGRKEREKKEGRDGEEGGGER